MTYIVALTGGICSGKTTISNGFKKIGISIIDSDVITKNIIKYDVHSSYYIKKKFGKKILNLDNSINRKLLRKCIFNNNNDRLWLENLLYPKIYQETKKQIKSAQSVWSLWVVPLLIEKKLEKKADRILLIDIPIMHQIKRIIKRDKINIYEAKKIVLLQATRRQRIAVSNDIIVNKKNNIIQYIYYFNSFYLYLAKQNCFNQAKNYLTKFY